MELDINGPDSGTIIPYLIRHGLVTNYDALIGQLRAAPKTALIGPILDALYEQRSDDVATIVEALDVDSLPLLESLHILPEVRMSRLLSFLNDPELNEQAVCGAIRRTLDQSQFSSDYMRVEHAKLPQTNLGPLVYLTLFDAMGQYYDILTRLLNWLCSTSAPTRKIAQNLLYRAIQAGLNWVNGQHGIELVALCQVLEENQQHIVQQHHHDWTFAAWHPALRNCAIKRAFNHENKKVISSLYRRIMGSIKLTGDGLDLELLEVIVSTSTHLYLYKGDHAIIDVFIQNNTHLGSAILVALSKQAQSAECLFLWTLALFNHAVWDEKSGLMALEAIQQISRQIQQTHQIQLRSVTTSLLVQLVVRIQQQTSQTSIYFKTLSRMRLGELAESDSDNIPSLLKANPFPADEIANLAQLNASNAREMALGCIYGANGLELLETFYRRARCAFDQADADCADSAIRVLLELDKLGATFNSHLAVSFFEFLFVTFKNEHTVEMGSLTAQLASVCLDHLPNENMKRLTRDKIIKLALANLSTPASAAFSLAQLTSVKLELTQIEPILPFATQCRDFTQRPRPDQMRQMMTSTWSIIGSVKKVDNLIELANDALPRLETDGQLIILSAVKGVSQTADVLETAWAAVVGSNERLHDIYHAYLELLIKSDLSNDQFEFYIDEIFKLAATKSGMILPLVKALAQSEWHIDQMESTLMKIIFYEVAKVDRLEDALGDELAKVAHVVDAVTDITRQVEQDECLMLRLEVLRLLKLKTSSNRVNIMVAVVRRANAETRNKLKYYIDSHTHRLKERAWQVVLFLLTDADYARSKLTFDQAQPLFELIVKATINDEQASVSALQQLCLVQLLHGHCQLHHRILEVINAFGDEQNTGQSISVSGMLLVSFLFGMGDNSDLLLSLIPIVLRLQQSNNYIVRIYAIGLSAAILSYFEQCDNMNELDKKYPFFTEHVAFWRRVSNGNVGKNVARVLANPFVSGHFQVPRDLTLRSMMRSLLKLNGSQGGVTLSAFERQCTDHFDLDISSSFDEDAETYQSEAAKVLTVEMANHSVSDVAAQQQKIAPWMDNEPNGEIKKKEGLIVCCSLLDKANNLGGITRTAEIFGATELIFDNLNVLNDKNYTALAVTAMKWIKISEVKRNALIEWFRAIKARNYQLVAVEQTTNSVEIQEYDFGEHRKTALVLGNEREGIPIELIPYFDAVVEIPQRNRMP